MHHAPLNDADTSSTRLRRNGTRRKGTTNKHELHECGGISLASSAADELPVPSAAGTLRDSSTSLSGALIPWQVRRFRFRLHPWLSHVVHLQRTASLSEWKVSPITSHHSPPKATHLSVISYPFCPFSAPPTKLLSSLSSPQALA